MPTREQKKQNNNAPLLHTTVELPPLPLLSIKKCGGIGGIGMCLWCCWKDLDEQDLIEFIW